MDIAHTFIGMVAVLNQFIGFFLGVFASYGVWWFVTRRITSKIEFSEIISKIESEEREGNTYRIKYANRGKRSIIDADFSVQLRIKGLFKKKPNNWKIINLRSKVDHKLLIRRHKNGGNIFHINYRNHPAFGKPYMPDYIREKFENKTLELEDILTVTDHVKLNVVVLAYDEYSGSRSLYISKTYGIKDIHEGYFDPGSLKPMISKKKAKPKVESESLSE